MNTTHHAHGIHEFSASDALFDKIEQDLLALTIAPLDGRAGAPLQSVDEFADDFLSAWSLPQQLS
jgi:hypothetical protein